MAKEIERKYLVLGDAWRDAAVGSQRLRQAYLAATDTVAIRVRIVESKSAFLTIKSAAPGISRDEFEYPVPVADAEAMLALRVGAVIEKVRYELQCMDGELTVDEFLGANAGLVIAEIELADASVSPALPDWLGREVTDARRFYNANLSSRPYSDWTAEEAAP